MSWPERTLLVAELGSNHNGDWSRAQALIEAAARAGASHVKLQLLRRSRLWEPGTLARLERGPRPLPLEVPCEWLERAAALCSELGIGLACTPFDLESLQQILPFVEFVKIASGDLTYRSLLQAAAASGKPLVLSTGASYLHEVAHALAWIAPLTEEVALLHCVSCYPCPRAQASLAMIQDLRTLGRPVGYSDHTASLAVNLVALLGLRVALLEVHLDLPDRAGQEAGHSLKPEDLGLLAQALVEREASIGSFEKRPLACELEERFQARRSSWSVQGQEQMLRPFRSRDL